MIFTLKKNHIGKLKKMKIQIEIMHDCKAGIPMAIVNWLLDMQIAAYKIKDIMRFTVKVVED